LDHVPAVRVAANVGGQRNYLPEEGRERRHLLKPHLLNPHLLNPPLLNPPLLNPPLLDPPLLNPPLLDPPLLNQLRLLRQQQRPLHS
jgi:hypothetical protein